MGIYLSVGYTLGVFFSWELSYTIPFIERSDFVYSDGSGMGKGWRVVCGFCEDNNDRTDGEASEPGVYYAFLLIGIDVGFRPSIAPDLCKSELLKRFSFVTTFMFWIREFEGAALSTCSTSSSRYD